MATQNPDTNVDFILQGFDPTVANRQSAATNLNYHNPYAADEFQMWSVNRRTGDIVHVNECLLSANWIDDLEEVVISGSAEFSNFQDASGKRIADYIGKGTELRVFVRHPVTGKMTEKDRFVVWERERSSEGGLTVTFFNHMKFLADSEVTVLFTKNKRKRDWDAREITLALAKQYGIPISRIPKATRKIPYFYQENETLLDVLLRLWTLESKATGKKFVFRMVKGRLVIATKGQNPRGLVVEVSNDQNDGGMLNSASTRDDINGTKTIVRLWGTSKDFSESTTDSRRAVVKSKQYGSRKGVAAWGRIYHESPVEGVVTQGDIERRAKNKLKQLSKSHFAATISIVGYPWLATGAAIRINNEASGAIGLFWLKTTEHSLSGSGEYKMTSQMSRYDFTKTLTTEATDLQSDNPNGQNSVYKKSNAIPKEVWNVIRAAAPAAGVPQSWANSKSLEKLLQGESSFRWNADNPSSTAYGLFQFLDTTWAGVGITKAQATEGYIHQGKKQFNAPGVGWIPYWKYFMCVAGLKYIKQRYGSAEKAYSFWKSKSPHWY